MERVIWERTIDHERINQRRRRFIQWFCFPAAACLLAGLFFAGWKNAIGIAILLAIIGALLGSWVRFSSLSDQANPTLVHKDGQIILGKESVRIADIDTYTSFMSSTQTSVFGDRSRIHIGKVLFRLRTTVPGSRSGEKELVEFGWPNMDEAGVESIEAALEPVLVNKWIPPEEFFPPEKPSRRGRRPSTRHYHL